MASKTRVYGLAGLPADQWAIDDLTGLDGLSREVVAASLNGTLVPITNLQDSQWREGYTKDELLSILGRKTKAELESAFGERIRTTKKEALESLKAGYSKEGLAELLEYLTPTMVEPVFEVGTETKFVADLAEKVDLGDLRKKRPGDIGNFELGPFPSLEVATDAADHTLTDTSEYIHKYIRSVRLTYEGPASWYLECTFWENQSDRKRRGVKRK